MRRSDKLIKIQAILNELYPNPQIPLDYRDTYTLLVSTVLSAQCTDIRVNQIAPLLFSRAATPEEMIQLESHEVREIIKPCGLAHTKSKSIVSLSKILIEQHDGKVPDTFEKLEALPGVGHKTASVVISGAFGKPAFPIDTHVHRLAARWGLSSGKSVTQTERDLKRHFPRQDWNKLHLQLIFFGREHCPARGHDFLACPICSFATSKAQIKREQKKRK